MSPTANLAEVPLDQFTALPAGMAGTRAGEWLSLEHVRSNVPNATAAALAALLVTLKLGPPTARAALPWPPHLWDRWRQVARVVIGGEALAGPLGEEVVAAAGAWLPRLGLHKMRLFLPQPPEYLPLFGLAATLSDGPALLLDVDNRRIRRLRGTVAGGQLVNWTPWPTLDWSPDSGEEVLADAVAELLQATQVSRVALSIASSLDVNLVPVAGIGSGLGRPLDDVLLESLDWPRPLELTVMEQALAVPRAFAADGALLLGDSVSGGVNPTRV